MVSFVQFFHISILCVPSQIFVAYPLGRVIEHECDHYEKLVVSNLALKNYNAAAVGVTKFSPLNSKVVVEVGKQLKREMSKYSKDPGNYFKYRGNMEHLAEFQNETFIKDAQEKLPILHTLIQSSFRSSKKVKNASNKQSLILASFLNPWMPNNNFTYRINTILVLGGCQKEEIDCFHNLGICSHANTMRNMQEKAASSFDNEVMEQKNAIMNRAHKIRLFEEVLSSQLHSSPGL